MRKMPLYQYRARDRSGRPVDGTLEAESRAQVVDKLRAQGYIITALSEADAVAAGARAARPARKVGPTMLTLIARQLAAMLGAGVPLISALNILADQMDKPGIRMVITEVRQHVESGESLSTALRKFPGVFPPLFTYMVEAGEASGSLETVLGNLAHHYDREVETRQKVTSALAYPVVLVCVAIGVILALTMFVLPTFIGMFQEFGTELPALTMGLYKVGNTMRDYWYLVFGLPVLVVIALLQYRKTEQGKKQIDPLILRIPLFGPVVRKTIVGRFARTMAMLTKAGVPILQSLELLERLVGNAVFAQALSSARQGVKEGAGLARPLKQSGAFPPMVTHMVGIGEETGALDSMLDRVADFYDRDVEYSVKSLTSMIEPAIILVMGAIVALVMASVLLPMFDMMTQVM